MKIKISNFVGLVKANEHELELDSALNLREVITELKSKLNITDSNDKLDFYVTYLKEITKENNIEYFQEKIDNFDLSLKDYTTKITSTAVQKNTGFNFSEDARIVIKNKPPFISIKMVHAITFAYAVPVLIILLLFLRVSHPSFLQVVVLLISAFHFAKRTYESNYVNTYTGEFDITVCFGLVFYYWILYAVIVSYNIFHPDYTNSHSDITVIILAACYLFSEYMNYSCHMILKDLKLKNKGFRGIPEGNMFEYVSCAHYFWELITWIVFFILVGTVSSFLFVIYSLLSMFFMAKSKHEGYLKYFGDKYPKHRKIMIPFLL